MSSDLGFFEPQLAQEDTRNEGDIEIEEIENFAPALLDEEEELLNDPDFAELLLSSKNSKEILGEIRKESRKIGLVDGQAMQANFKVKLIARNSSVNSPPQKNQLLLLSQFCWPCWPHKKAFTSCC
jgi:hypothetical protein